jgi:hypothetical protein
MIQIPANLAQRILDAARIAVLLHEEGARRDDRERLNAGGAGLARVGDDDGRYVKDDNACSTDCISRPRA